MPVRPTRSNPLSTRPVYLPRVPAKELQEAATTAKPAPAGAIRIYIEGDASALDLQALATRLRDALGRETVVAGEIVSALAGRPQTEVRRMVATAANALAWARIRDVSRKDYRMLPLRSEVDEEESLLRGRSRPSYEGVRHPDSAYAPLYDAVALQRAYRYLLGGGPAIVVTERRFALWDGDAWSETALAPGDPLLVSATGAASETTEALASRMANALRLA